MVSAHLSTIGDVRQAGASKASQDASSSLLIVHHEDQKGGAVSGSALRRLSHLRFQIGAGGSSLAQRRAGAASLSSLRIGHPIDAFRLPAARVQSLFDQQLSQCLADRLHLSLRLSSSLSSRWIDPNESGLTYAQISFASGAKADD